MCKQRRGMMNGLMRKVGGSTDARTWSEARAGSARGRAVNNGLSSKYVREPASAPIDVMPGAKQGAERHTDEEEEKE